jgi:hypothetical protein
MNKIIKVIKFGASDDVRKAIEHMITQLEKYNFTYCNNSGAFRLFSKNTPECYKRSDTLTFARVVSKDNTVKNIITLKPDYKIERYGDYSFKIRIR